MSIRRLFLLRGLAAFGGSALGLPMRAAAAATQARAAALHWHETALPLLGTTAWLRLGHEDAAQAKAAAAAAVAAFRRIDQAANLLRGDSAIVRLNRDGGLDEAPVELHALVHAAQRMAAASGGAFDPTVQPLWRLWADAAASGLRPDAAALAERRGRIGWHALMGEGRRLRFERPGMGLTLNGIAQGFAADAAAAELRRHGIAHALIDSGEWQPIGRAPDGGEWTLGVARAAGTDRMLARLRSDGRAIASSADDSYRFFGGEGAEHHILDPRSGRSPTALRRVVVAAPSAAWADALTKPVMLAGSASAALALARRLGADALVVERSGRWRATPGMPLAV